MQGNLENYWCFEGTRMGCVQVTLLILWNSKFCVLGLEGTILKRICRGVPRGGSRGVTPPFADICQICWQNRTVVGKSKKKGKEKGAKKERKKEEKEGRKKGERKKRKKGKWNDSYFFFCLFCFSNYCHQHNLSYPVAKFYRCG